MAISAKKASTRADLRPDLKESIAVLVKLEPFVFAPLGDVFLACPLKSDVAGHWRGTRVFTRKVLLKEQRLEIRLAINPSRLDLLDRSQRNQQRFRNNFGHNVHLTVESMWKQRAFPFRRRDPSG